MGRKQRRLSDPDIKRKAQEYLATISGKGPNLPSQAGGSILAGPLGTSPGIASNPASPGGGWGVGGKGASAAGGKQPSVNPFIIPKASGINVISQTYPSNYFVEWNLSTQRIACDRVLTQGWTPDWATLATWCFQSSPFVQSMFRTIETAVNSIPYYFADKRGNILEDWTEELCNKLWHYELRKHIAHSFFWGFTGLNMDPEAGLLYKYPMQDIDPINRFLRQSTYALWDGTFFEENDNLLFIQPSTAQEDFLGWMQAITRMFVQMNMNDTSWVAAARKLAFPIFTIGYPEGSGAKDAYGNDYNPYKDEAEMIARDIGPGSAIIFPFTKSNISGEIQKNIEIEYENPGTSQKAHSIYLDFNTEKKNEIREMILGGTLTADVGDSGSRALGEVQERKLRKFLAPVIRYVVAYLNGEFKRKVSKWYTNFPKDGKFIMDEGNKFTIEEVVSWSGVLQASGKQFTDEFFEKNGMEREFFEDRPEPVAPDEKAQPLSKKNDGKINNLTATQVTEKKNFI